MPEAIHACTYMLRAYEKEENRREREKWREKERYVTNVHNNIRIMATISLVWANDHKEYVRINLTFQFLNICINDKPSSFKYLIASISDLENFI